MFAQSLFIITKQVESVVSIVLLVFVDVVRVCPLEGLQELSVDTVFVELSQVIFDVLSVIVEGIVHVDGHTFDRSQLQGHGVPEVIVGSLT